MYPKAPLKGLFGPEMGFSAHNIGSQNAVFSLRTEEYSIASVVRTLYSSMSSVAHTVLVPRMMCY